MLDSGHQSELELEQVVMAAWEWVVALALGEAEATCQTDLQVRETLPFNGYGEHVAQLYTGMDLTKNY